MASATGPLAHEGAASTLRGGKAPKFRMGACCECGAAPPVGGKFQCCERCRVPRYCGPAHQLAAWTRAHRLRCGQLRPTPDGVAAADCAAALGILDEFSHHAPLGLACVRRLTQLAASSECDSAQLSALESKCRAMLAAPHCATEELEDSVIVLQGTLTSAALASASPLPHDAHEERLRDIIFKIRKSHTAKKDEATTPSDDESAPSLGDESKTPSDGAETPTPPSDDARGPAPLSYAKWTHVEDRDECPSCHKLSRDIGTPRAKMWACGKCKQQKCELCSDVGECSICAKLMVKNVW